MRQSCDSWYGIGASEYLCRFYTVLAIPCISIHVFTPDASLLQSHIRIICSPWCIHFEISVLRSIQNWVLGSFWIPVIAEASNCWLYAPPAIVITIGKCAVMILVLILFFYCSSIHYQRPRFLNSWPFKINMHDTSSTTMISVSPLLNGPS